MIPIWIQSQDGRVLRHRVIEQDDIDIVVVIFSLGHQQVWGGIMGTMGRDET